MPKKIKKHEDEIIVNEQEPQKTPEKTDSNIIGFKSIILIAIIAVLLAVNQLMLFSINANVAGTSSYGNMQLTSSSLQAAMLAIIPTGVPIIYGNEMGIKYDGVSASNLQLADATISKLGSYDRSITLIGDDLQRYIKIASQISCEYCCGAQSIIFSDGKAACGCAHSYAMRGLAKYLIKNHPSEFTDDQILEELGKWKTLFFPGNLAQKALVLKEKGIKLNYINLASNKYRDIEKGQTSGGGMVGGC